MYATKCKLLTNQETSYSST